MEDHPGIFDITRLQSAEFRDYFQRIQERMEEVSRSIKSGCGLREGVSDIKPFIAHELEFNAEAKVHAATAYISINASVLLSLRILFDRIFSMPWVLPRLESGDTPDNITYKAQFILDTNAPREWSQLDISLSRERYKASGILSDLCVTFIFLHEFGHLLCGHAEACNSLFPNSSVTEFTRSKSNEQADLRQYWEYQADNVAASFLSQYIGHFIDHVKSHQSWLLKAANVTSRQHKNIAIHATAMTLAALHVLCLYMDGCKFENQLHSYHPPAQSRMMYIKDRIATAMQARLGVNPNTIIKTYFKDYFSSFVSALDELGLPARHGFGDQHMDEVEAVNNKLMHSNRRFREVCRPWSWLPVEEWQDP